MWEQLEHFEGRGLVSASNLTTLGATNSLKEMTAQAPGAARPEPAPVGRREELPARLAECLPARTVPTVAMLLGGGLGERPRSVDELLAFTQRRAVGLGTLAAALEQLQLGPAARAVKTVAEQARPVEPVGPLDPWGLLKLELARQLGTPQQRQTLLHAAFPGNSYDDAFGLAAMEPLPLLEELEARGQIGPHNLAMLSSPPGTTPDHVDAGPKWELRNLEVERDQQHASLSQRAELHPKTRAELQQRLLECIRGEDVARLALHLGAAEGAAHESFAGLWSWIDGGGVSLGRLQSALGEMRLGLAERVVRDYLAETGGRG
jgi:hypothetical protein